jgi:uncharacterized membrane protein YheB (UPF0754 family)
MTVLTVLIPLISAFIGWITNWIAIKMLFHPRKPFRIMGLTIQGIFPKRQGQFAQKLGKMVSEQLLSFTDIESKITSTKNIEKILPVVEGYVDDFLRRTLSDEFPVISMFIGDKTIQHLKEVFMNKLKEIFPPTLKSYMHTLREDLDLERIVTEKVAGFSSDELEKILYQIMSKEFRFVEIVGGVVGFIIGVIQVLLTYWMS